MKKLILIVALIMSANLFAHESVNQTEMDEPVIIILSCGGNAVFDDEGMTDEEIFNSVAFIDWAMCDAPTIGWGPF